MHGKCAAVKKLSIADALGTENQGEELAGAVAAALDAAARCPSSSSPPPGVPGWKEKGSVALAEAGGVDRPEAAGACEAASVESGAAALFTGCGGAAEAVVLEVELGERSSNSSSSASGSGTAAKADSGVVSAFSAPMRIASVDSGTEEQKKRVRWRTDQKTRSLFFFVAFFSPTRRRSLRTDRGLAKRGVCRKSTGGADRVACGGGKGN